MTDPRLDAAITAFDDWLHQYATDLCGEDAMRETWERIMNSGGTISYITETRMGLEALREELKVQEMDRWGDAFDKDTRD